MGLRRSFSLWRQAAGDIRYQLRYQRARQSLLDDVARTPPDADDGVHIRGPVSDWEESTQMESNNPSQGDKAPFGRREYDLSSDNLITKKLVIGTAVLVNALFLAGDALFFGPNVCP